MYICIYILSVYLSVYLSIYLSIYLMKSVKFGLLCFACRCRRCLLFQLRFFLNFVTMGLKFCSVRMVLFPNYKGGYDIINYVTKSRESEFFDWVEKVAAHFLVGTLCDPTAWWILSS